MRKKILVALVSASTLSLMWHCGNAYNKLNESENMLAATESKLAKAEATIVDLTKQLNSTRVEAASLRLDLDIAKETVLTEVVTEVIETPRHYNVGLPAELQTYTYTVCNEYGIPEYYELMLALMQHESNFVDTVVSSTSDYGLAQINKINHEWLEEELGLTDMLNPYQNIRAGVYFLSTYIHKYDDLAAALMCYNLGEPAATECFKRGVRSTTYSDSILAIYREYIDIKINE